MFGPDKDLENCPTTIEMVSNFFKVEVDIWKIDRDYFLGHDDPQYLISFDWLVYLQPKLMLHCKNRLAYDCQTLVSFHRFMHEDEASVTCSRGNILKHPDCGPLPGSYNMMPELSKNETLETILSSKAVCTDYPAFLQTIKERNAKTIFSDDSLLSLWGKQQ